MLNNSKKLVAKAYKGKRVGGYPSGVILFLASSMEVLRRMPSSLRNGRVPLDTYTPLGTDPFKGQTPLAFRSLANIHWMMVVFSKMMFLYRTSSMMAD